MSRDRDHGESRMADPDTYTEGKWLSPGRSRALVLLAMAQFVIAFDFTAVVIVLPSIGRGLHAAQADLQWLVTAYAIALGGLLLLTGRLVDQRGPRRLFVLGHLVIVLGCAMSLAAGTVWLLICARVLVGIGAAFLSPATVALLNATFPAESARNRALGIWGSAGAAGGVLGLVIGGLIANYYGWQAIFVVTGVLCAASAALGPVWLLPDGARGQRLAGRNIVDGVLAVVGTVCLIWGLTEGAADPGSAALPVALAVGAGLLVAFVRRQAGAADPLLPLWLFRVSSFRLAAVIAFLFHMSLNNQVYAMTLRLQETFGFSTLAAGFLLMPNELAIVVGAHLGGDIVTRFGVRRPLILAMLAGALGVLLYSLYWRSGPGLVILIGGLVVSGLGQGLAWTALWSSATADVGAQRHGLASGLVSMTAQFGQALGIAVLTVVALTADRLGPNVDVGLRVGQYVIVSLAALGAVAAMVSRSGRVTT